MVRASTVRLLTRRVSLPGSYLRRALASIDAAIEYPKQPVVVTAQGGRLRFLIEDFHEYIQRNIYFMGYHEFRETRIVKKLLREGDTFVDVGANIGWFTVLAASMVKGQGSVVAFEPSTSIHEQLRANVELNGLTNVTLERVALSNQNGVAVLSGISQENAGTGTILASTKVGEKVSVACFDDYHASHSLGRIQVMKIDVEGAEMMVLEGAKDALRTGQIENIVVEVSDERLRSTGSSSAALAEMLREFGYRLFRATNTGLEPVDHGEHIGFVNLVAQRA